MPKSFEILDSKTRANLLCKKEKEIPSFVARPTDRRRTRNKTAPIATWTGECRHHMQRGGVREPTTDCPRITRTRMERLPCRRRQGPHHRHHRRLRRHQPRSHCAAICALSRPNSRQIRTAMTVGRTRRSTTASLGQIAWTAARVYALPWCQQRQLHLQHIRRRRRLQMICRWKLPGRRPTYSVARMRARGFTSARSSACEWCKR